MIAMRLFPHIHAEQDRVMDLFAAFRDAAEPQARHHQALEFCRVATQVLQVRNEMIFPFCARHAPIDLLMESMVEGDLACVLIREAESAQGGELHFRAVVVTLGRLLGRLFKAEEADGGLWFHLKDISGTESWDVLIGERLAKLDADGVRHGWRPIEPETLDTLRCSLPPGPPFPI